MKNRFLLLSIIVILLMTLTMTASAQDVQPVDFCFNLSEADCEIIGSASANNANITSFSHDFSLAFTAIGLEVLELLGQGFPQSIAFTADGNGAFTITDDSEAGFSLNADMASYQDFMIDVESGDIIGELQATDADTSWADTLEFILYDDVVYIPLPDESLSFPLSALTDLELPFGLQDMLPIYPETLVTLQPDSWGDILALVDIEGILAPNGMNLSEAVNYQRLEDVEGMGQALYPFEFNLDVSQILNNPEVTSLLITELSNLLGGSDDPMMALAPQLLPLLLPGVESDLVITQYVGSDDNFVHRITFDLGFLIDLGMLTRPSGSTAEESSIQPLDVNLHFDFNLTGINESVEIAPLDDARALSQAEIDQLLNSLMSSVAP